MFAVCGEVRYVTVKLGLVSTQASQHDKPTISLLIKSFLPTVIQHYFALPTQRFVCYSATLCIGFASKKTTTVSYFSFRITVDVA